MPEAPLRCATTKPALRPRGAESTRRSGPASESAIAYRPSSIRPTVPSRVFRPRPVPPGATTAPHRPISPNSTTIPLFRSPADPHPAAGFTCPVYRKQSPPGPENGSRHRQPARRSAPGRRLRPLPGARRTATSAPGGTGRRFSGCSFAPAAHHPPSAGRTRPHAAVRIPPGRRTKNVPAGSIRQGRNRICNGRSADPSPADALLRQPREQLRSFGGRTAASHRQAGRAYCLTLLAVFAARALSTSMMKSDSTFI